jgi:hypothetical protein
MIPNHDPTLTGRNVNEKQWFSIRGVNAGFSSGPDVSCQHFSYMGFRVICVRSCSDLSKDTVTVQSNILLCFFGILNSRSKYRVRRCAKGNVSTETIMQDYRVFGLRVILKNIALQKFNSFSSSGESVKVIFVGSVRKG